MITFLKGFFSLRSLGRFMFDLFIFFIMFSIITGDGVLVPYKAFEEMCDLNPSILAENIHMKARCVEAESK